MCTWKKYLFFQTFAYFWTKISKEHGFTPETVPLQSFKTDQILMKIRLELSEELYPLTMQKYCFYLCFKHWLLEKVDPQTGQGYCFSLGLIFCHLWTLGRSWSVFIMWVFSPTLFWLMYFQECAFKNWRKFWGVAHMSCSSTQLSKLLQQSVIHYTEKQHYKEFRKKSFAELFLCCRVDNESKYF